MNWTLISTIIIVIAILILIAKINLDNKYSTMLFISLGAILGVVGVYITILTVVEIFN
jgi:hypothetical protein